MKFIILGYRDAYFWNQYGTSVRDLQIAEIIAREHKVIFINRPVSLYERLLSKKAEFSKIPHPNITFVDTTSYNLLGPLKKGYGQKIVIPILLRKFYAKKMMVTNILYF